MSGEADGREAGVPESGGTHNELSGYTDGSVVQAGVVRGDIYINHPGASTRAGHVAESVEREEPEDGGPGGGVEGGPDSDEFALELLLETLFGLPRWLWVTVCSFGFLASGSALTSFVLTKATGPAEYAQGARVVMYASIGAGSLFFLFAGFLVVLRLLGRARDLLREKGRAGPGTGPGEE